MRLSRILLFMGALALSALPAAAQGRGIKPAGVGKPTTTTAKGPSATGAAKGKSADAKGGTLTKGKSADAKGPKTTATDADTPETDTDIDTASDETKGRGQLPLNEKIALNNTLKARLDALLVGTTMTFDQATTGWRNQGQLVSAMNAAQNNNLSFVAIHQEMVTNHLALPDAVAVVKGATTTTTTTTTTDTTTTTTTP